MRAAFRQLSNAGPSQYRLVRSLPAQRILYSTISPTITTAEDSNATSTSKEENEPEKLQAHKPPPPSDDPADGDDTPSSGNSADKSAAKTSRSAHSERLRARRAGWSSGRQAHFKPIISERFIKSNVMPLEQIVKITEFPHGPQGVNGPCKDSDLDGKKVFPVSIPSLTHTQVTAYIRTLLRSPAKVNWNRHQLLLRAIYEDTIYVLDGYVLQLAKQFTADVVQLDAHDFAEMIQNIEDPGDTKLTEFIKSKFGDLGYVIKQRYRDEDQPGFEEEEDEGMDEEDDYEELARKDHLHKEDATALRIFSTPFVAASSGSASVTQAFSLNEKLTSTLTAAIDAVITKRGKDADPERPVFIYLRDYTMLSLTAGGPLVLSTLKEVIRKKRAAGGKYILVATEAGYPQVGTEELEPRLDIPFNPIDLSTFFRLDYYRKARTLEINLRNLQIVVGSYGAGLGEAAPKLVLPKDFHLDASNFMNPMLHDSHGIQKRETWEEIARLAIGSTDRALLNMEDIGRAYDLRSKAEQVVTGTDREMVIYKKESQNLDDDRTVLLSQEEQREVTREANEKGWDIAVGLKQAAEKKLIQRLRAEEERRSRTKQPAAEPKIVRPADCNKHEVQLLSAIVDPHTIDEGFADIRTPPSTVHALKNSISLRLNQPDAFKYGILAKNQISGVLLYGPPGTGKTLLAKAVAKECGARVLDIKGSEIQSMWVGEGEKNIKALFSLARKIAPTVIFLDEVDALFAARSEKAQQNHREVINQFMAEWDGIRSKNLGVIVMGATNRPFDLDEAILRRMPRRIMVDLPTEEDRLAILKIHLKDEKIHDEVDLRALANRTVRYSGSDLKNVVISAALTAVSEAMAKNLPVTERVLTNAHFEAALKEVKSSVPEGASILSELRKWHAKLNGKEKKGLWGFAEKVESKKENEEQLPKRDPEELKKETVEIEEAAKEEAKKKADAKTKGKTDEELLAEFYKKQEQMGREPRVMWELEPSRVTDGEVEHSRESDMKAQEERLSTWKSSWEAAKKAFTGESGSDQAEKKASDEPGLKKVEENKSEEPKPDKPEKE
ncbi:hypothetical protein YB2330_000293 [Saitoella coloradoensis]